ncbi:aldo/keto reductase [Limosilactobacillus sp. STM2_1]|uniref:Aldo/keto reductase n=1 Tax=Limosilactobacillus rudii TaxID=2759755 RepID=A0A7W3UL91_9LACO|nr:aldo/keto reductase [Limosilactobacillus rudii]MBB1079583.1 aldo/keto reductase [Limosilactobacillus rudii]MBB1097629.1 aldo/keto reductase [Limosilactobacillus rudii]MCD7134738.1 aldo/keto reductase [Limosilactobacillus rudii]
MNGKSALITLADGQKMPQEGFGLYKVHGQETMNRAISDAYQAGFRLFDTAQLYDNEAEVGEALQRLNVPRDEYFVTTKIAEANESYEKAIASVKESLRKLKLDYVNLLLIHWPTEKYFFESWRALEELKKMGLTRSIGVSNYPLIHLQYLATQANEMPVVDQVERHPLLNQAPLIKFNRQHNIVTQAWSPLGRGKILTDPVLEKIAAEHGKSVAQVILRWHLQSGIAFIPKAVTPQHIQQNIALNDFSLSDIEMEQIAALNNFQRFGKEPALAYEYNHKYETR